MCRSWELTRAEQRSIQRCSHVIDRGLTRVGWRKEAKMLTLIVIAGLIWLLIATIFVMSLVTVARLENSTGTVDDGPDPSAREATNVSVSIPAVSAPEAPA